MLQSSQLGCIAGGREMNTAARHDDGSTLLWDLDRMLIKVHDRGTVLLCQC